MRKTGIPARKSAGGPEYLPANRQADRNTNTALINKKATRKFILAKCASMRPNWPFERVSAEALDIIDARLRSMIVSMVEGHPSVGKTFRP